MPMTTSSSASIVRRAGVSDRCPHTQQRRSPSCPARLSWKNVRMICLRGATPSVLGRRTCLTPSLRRKRHDVEVEERIEGLLDDAEPAVVATHVPQAPIVIHYHLEDADVLGRQREDP